MRKASYPQGKWRDLVFLLTALLIIAVDQLTKIWIRANLALGQAIPEAGFFRITRVCNTGASFGLFQGQAFMLSIVTIAGIVFLLICAFFLYRRFPLLSRLPSRVTIGLILGGAVGNLIDRLRFGCVTDFIDIGPWPSFNVADSAIVVGAIVFAYSLLLLARTVRTEFPGGED